MTFVAPVLPVLYLYSTAGLPWMHPCRASLLFLSMMTTCPSLEFTFCRFVLPAGLSRGQLCWRREWPELPETGPGFPPKCPFRPPSMILGCRRSSRGPKVHHQWILFWKPNKRPPQDIRIEEKNWWHNSVRTFFWKVLSRRTRQKNLLQWNELYQSHIWWWLSTLTKIASCEAVLMWVIFEWALPVLYLELR